MLTPTTGITLEDYNAAVLAGGYTHARLVFPVQNITLTGANISANGGIKITDLLNPDEDLTFGKAIARELVVYLLNGDIFNGFDWTEEFHVDFGVDINGSTKWVTVGYFKGKRPARVKRVDIIEFTAVDRMQMFNEVADNFLDTLTYPTTMGGIYHDLCSYIGINYAVGDEIADAMNVQYDECPFDRGITNRALLSYIAQANCCYAVITADGYVKLKWFSDQTSNYSITGHDYYDFVIGEENVPAIDAVNIATTDPEGTGFVYPVSYNNAYEIVNNPLLLKMETSEKMAIITEMLSRFTAIGAYKAMNVPVQGNWMIEAGDIIQVVYDDNETANMPIFTRQMFWNGGCNDVYECTGGSEREEVTNDIAEEYKQDGKYYRIRSGVDITEDGVTVSGGKYVKILSGGVFDVQSQNFKINSDTGIVESGNWKFNGRGLSLREEIDGHNVDMQIGDDTADQGAYYTLFVDRNVKQFQQGISTHYAPILKFGAIDNRGESDDFSWGLDVDYVENPITPLGLGFPGLLPKGNNNWHLGSEDNPWGTAHIRIGNIGIVQADDVATKDFKCSPDAFTTMAGIVNALANGSTGDVFTMRFANGLTGQFFNSSNNYAGVLIVVKASSSNAYFLAFNRAAASIGNISIDNGTVNSKTMLS